MAKSNDDENVNWAEVDVEAVKRMIAEADSEGGEIPLSEVARRLASRSSSRPR
jgi:hypothetical protein